MSRTVPFLVQNGTVVGSPVRHVHVRQYFGTAQQDAEQTGELNSRLQHAACERAGSESTSPKQFAVCDRLSHVITESVAPRRICRGLEKGWQFSQNLAQ